MAKRFTFSDDQIDMIDKSLFIHRASLMTDLLSMPRGKDRDKVLSMVDDITRILVMMGCEMKGVLNIQNYA